MNKTTRHALIACAAALLLAPLSALRAAEMKVPLQARPADWQAKQVEIEKASAKTSHGVWGLGLGAWSNVAEVERVGGIKGFRCTDNKAWTGTELLTDPKWKPSPDSNLGFKFYCTEPQMLIFSGDNYDAVVEITASDNWQEMVIPANKFINSASQKRMGSWKDITVLHIKPKANADMTKVVFAQFRWVVSRNPAAGKNDAAILVVKRYDSPIHFQPQVGKFGDPIPFFWKGEYHVFYLNFGIKNSPWEHIVSTDLIHWRQLPVALVASGPPDGPDGANQFTGSVTEKDGTFHIFYTGHNPNNPLGLEFTLHATSPDLITWTKHPEDIIGPDGVIYKNQHKSDWRDSYVFWNEEEQQHWMIMCSDSLKGGGSTGLLTSKDLKTWKHEPPLSGAGVGECPDLFKIGNLWYLVGAGHYAVAKSPRGPYRMSPVISTIDAPFIYAGKRMFDGKRHIWTGWFGGDSPSDGGNKPGGGGGTQCLPRELYAGPDGQLFCKPVDEVIAVFKKTVLSRENFKVDGASMFDVPDNYMVECQVQFDPKAELVIVMRQQPDSGDAYRFVVSPEKSEAQLSVPEFNFKRPCPVDTTKPIKFQAFVQGKFIECFINDRYATSCRAYSFYKGRLGFEVHGGVATVLSLVVKVDDGMVSDKPTAGKDDTAE